MYLHLSATKFPFYSLLAGSIRGVELLRGCSGKGKVFNLIPGRTFIFHLNEGKLPPFLRRISWRKSTFSSRCIFTDCRNLLSRMLFSKKHRAEQSNNVDLSVNRIPAYAWYWFTICEGFPIKMLKSWNNQIEKLDLWHNFFSQPVT